MNNYILKLDIERDDIILKSGTWVTLSLIFDRTEGYIYKITSLDDTNLFVFLPYDFFNWDMFKKL